MSLHLGYNPGYLWISCWVVIRGLALKEVSVFSIVGHRLIVVIL